MYRSSACGPGEEEFMESFALRELKTSGIPLLVRVKYMS